VPGTAPPAGAVDPLVDAPAVVSRPNGVVVHVVTVMIVLFPKRGDGRRANLKVEEAPVSDITGFSSA
jgi:hypothetical protein